MAALSVEPFVAERALNHKVREVESMYNLYDYFSERKATLDRWSDVLKAVSFPSTSRSPQAG